MEQGRFGCIRQYTTLKSTAFPQPVRRSQHLTLARLGLGVEGGAAAAIGLAPPVHRQIWPGLDETDGSLSDGRAAVKLDLLHGVDGKPTTAAARRSTVARNSGLGRDGSERSWRPARPRRS